MPFDVWALHSQPAFWGKRSKHYCVTILCAAPVSKLQPSNMDIEAGV
jgi:hypothetical protein